MNKKTRNILLAVVALFVIVGTAACDSNESKSDDSNESSSQPAPQVEDAANEEAVDEPEVDPDTVFKVIFAQDADVLSEVADEGGLAGDGYSNMDIESGVTHARNAADLLNDLVGKYDSMDETQASDFGQDVMSALTQCANAWDASADSAAALDIEGMTAATTELNTCSANMNDLTSRM